MLGWLASPVALSEWSIVQIAEVTLSDGSRHALYAGVPGSLLEINPKLLTQPHLVRTDPQQTGWLCVIMTHPGFRERGLVSLAAYQQAAPA